MKGGGPAAGAAQRRRSLACVLALAAPWAGCDDGPRPQEGAAAGSTTLAWDPAGSALWVTSPDDDALVELHPDSLEEMRRIELEGGPEHLAPIGGRLVVTLGRAREVAVVDVASGAVERVRVPCGGTRAVVPLQADASGTERALVSCPNDDLLVELALSPPSVRRIVRASGRPTSLAVGDRVVAVTASRTGMLRALSLSLLDAAPLVDGSASSAEPLPFDRVEIDALTLVDEPGHAATHVDALTVDGASGRFFAAYQRVEHDADRERSPEQGGYGSIVDGEPRIEPRLVAPCGGRYARFDGGARVASGPSALARAPGSQLLWVANRYTENVLVLACPDGGPRDPARPLAVDAEQLEGELELVATFRVGAGLRGLLLTADGRTAYADVGFEHAVARLSLDEGPTEPLLREVAAMRRRDLGETVLSAEARVGRRVFYDAVNTHLTPSGVVTCETCHPGGGDDGLSWFLHTRHVGPKLRRTPPAWQARANLAPYHWDGEFASVQELTRATIVELLEGDALLVDLDAVAAWLDEAPAPPPAPIAPDARELVERGQTLFASDEVGCGGCHGGPDFTDGQTHSVVPVAADPMARLEQVDTPTLVGVRARAPYLHDGRAESIRAVLVAHNGDDLHGRTSHLDEAEVDALVAYLSTL